MSTLLQLQGGTKAFGSKVLFDDASFAVNEGTHVGVIGPNGAGKTTLFKVLIGQEQLDHGEVVRSRNLRLGYLAQHDQWKPGETVGDFLECSVTLPIWEVKRLGRGLGLDDEIYARPVEALSGGYRMRTKLLALLGQQPNLMLLDEPTNYLDLETLMVLENFLQGYEGAFLLISHDREFLRRTTDHIVEVEGGDITAYPGNIDDYFEQKELLRQQLEARALSQAQKRKEILDFVARFGAKATKAAQAQSRLKQLDRMEEIEIKPLAVGARIPIPAPARVGKLVLELKDSELGYPTKTVLTNASLQVLGGDHIAVVGLNGAGKSTLLKSLSGELPLLKGSRTTGYEATVAYYAQHVAERLDPNATVVEAMGARAHPSILPQEVLNLAGSLLFSGDAAYKRISVLSGGEKARVALGQVLLQRASCLILDEPTNHLDFQTVEALTQALMDYKGTVIVVSHDRAFVRRIGNKILEVRKGELRVYPGSYDDYVWRLSRERLGGQESASAFKATDTAATPKSSESAESREKKKALERELRQLERKLSEAEKAVSDQVWAVDSLNAKMTAEANPSLALIQELNEAQTKLHSLEEQWMSAAERKQAVEEALAKCVRS
jgi:ATP-binding cassette subfamily F protein 3